MNKRWRYLYLMRNNRNDAVKIGISRNPTEREKTLQSEEPDVILLWRCPAYKDHEKLFHDCFSSKRIRGEWFRLSKYDIEFVKDEQRKFALLAGIGSESEQGILFAELSYVERQEVMEVRLIYLEESRMSNEEIYRKYSKEITEAKKQLRAIDRERTEYFAKLEPA